MGFVRGQKGKTMAKKANAPLLTHCELLCYAMRGIEAEINEWEQRIERSGITDRGAIIDALSQVAANSLNKRNYVEQLYLIETGTPYIR